MGFSVSESDAPVEDIFNGSMNTFSGDASESVDVGQPAHSVAGQTRGFAGSGTVRRRRTSSRRACAVQAVPLVGAGYVRAVHSAQRAGAEAGSDSLDNFVASFHSMRESRHGRVNAILHAQHSQNSQIHNSYSTPARSLHDVHVARCGQNSMNSLGDGVVRERGFCVPGRTKSLSTCTRTRVRRPAVEKRASPQQAPLNEFHDAQVVVPGAGAENDFHDAQVVVPGSSGAAARHSTLGTSGGCSEVNLNDAQLLPVSGLLEKGTSRGQREVADVVTVWPTSSAVSSAVGRRRQRAPVACVPRWQSR